MSTRVKVFIAVMLTVVLSAIGVWRLTRHAAKPEVAVAAPPAGSKAAPMAGSSPAAPSDVPSAARLPENPAELAATARMYAAHESLRAPEVADPDSATNRQILGVMVTKALAASATPPPAVATRQP